MEYDQSGITFDQLGVLYDHPGTTTYILTPPSQREGFLEINDPLWRWTRVDVGLSVVKIDGTWSVKRMGSYPGEAGLDAAYQGGRQYAITEAIYEELVADGLGEYAEVIP